MLTVEGHICRATAHASVTTVHLFVSLINKTPDRSRKSQGMWKACVWNFLVQFSSLIIDTHQYDYLLFIA